MFSNLVPFESVVERVKDDTDITIAKNQYPKIRRLLYRAEHDLGYGGTVILKKVKYSLTAGTILTDGNIYKLKLPQDIIHLEQLGCCHDNNLHPRDWRIQGLWLFFCKGVRPAKFTLYYYTLLHDGNGNPVTTENHFEAVVAGITYWMYKQGVFSGKKNANLLRYYEDYYHDRLGEARGADVFPSTKEEWKRIAEKLRWSYKDALIYSEDKRCFCEVPESILTSSVDPGGTTGGGGGYTDPNGVVPGGGTSGTGSSGPDPETGEVTDPNTGEVIPPPDGGYNPPVEPTEPTDPENPGEGENLPPTIDDITFYTNNGVTKVITWAMFVEGAPAPYNDPENDLMDAVKLDGLKFDNKGKWFYQGLEVGLQAPFGTVLFKENFDAGELIHIAWNEDDFNHDVLYFSVRDTVNGNWVS